MFLFLIFVTMPVMETDLEDPEYLGKRWESAVTAIISSINDTSTVVNNNSTRRPFVNSTLPATSGGDNHPTIHAVPATNITGTTPSTGVISAVPDNRPLPLPPSSRSQPAAPMAPPAPSVTVIPVLFPYVVPAGPSTSTTPPPAKLLEINATGTPPPLPPVFANPIGGNFSHVNHTGEGSSSGLDAVTAVGWSLFSLILLLVGLLAFALVSSRRLRVWIYHRVYGTR